MRVAFHSIFRTGLEGIGRSLEKVAELREKVATGRAFLRPSQDPSGAEKALRLQARLRFLHQLRSSAESAQTYLEAAESDLVEVGELLRQAKTVALAQRDATSDPEARRAAAAEVLTIRDRIVDTLNHSFNSRYLFAGHKTTTVPFVIVDGRVDYMGDDGEIAFRVGPHSMEVTNVPGSDLLEFGSPELESSLPLKPAVSGATLLSALQGGRGIPAGSFQIEDRDGTVLTINITNMTTVQDLLNAINNIPVPFYVSARINSTGDGIELYAPNSDDPIIVREVGGGTVAAELNLLGSSQGSIDSGDLGAVLDNATLISDLPGISGGSLGALEVYVGGARRVVDFSLAPPVSTIGELIARFNQSAPGLVMSLNADRDGLIVTGIEEFSLAALDGDPTAAELGLIGNGHGARLFGSMEGLYQALMSDDDQGIEDALAELEDVMAGWNGLQGVVGSRSERVDGAISILADRILKTQTELARVVDLDLAEAVVKLSESQLAYQAALESASSIFNLNIMNYL